jgi:CHAT domain-containing protein/chaperonin cofactor prefoldin
MSRSKEKEGQEPKRSEELRVLLDSLQHLTDPDTMPQRIEVCRAALALVDRNREPELWAGLHIELGNSLCCNSLINQADNLEKAIDHYQEALEVYNPRDSPHKWAMTQHNIGKAFAQRIHGKRADNIEKAIEHLQRALELCSKQDFPQNWAVTHNNLGNAYLKRICEKRADNLEKSIEHYQKALEVYHPQHSPQGWAMVQRNLGNAFTQRIRGKRVDNLERAIDHLHKALEVYNHQDFPEDWAMTHINLGIAYSNRICGKRADNLEMAIEHFQKALKFCKLQDFAEKWAMTHINLGTVYSERIYGKRADNLEMAIEHFQKALEFYNLQDFAEKWAATQVNLGNVYVERIHGERASNLEMAVEHLQKALEVYNHQDFPEDWAMTHINLGIAYSNRICGKRADNLEMAIEHFQKALGVYNLQDFPEKWAATQANLGNTYTQRIRGTRADNLERAIEYYQKSLEVYNRQDFPEQWAATENNLGNTYVQRIHGEQADNIEETIEHYQKALEIRIRQGFPEAWARTQRNLGKAYSKRICGDRLDNLDKAIGYYRRACEVFTIQQFPNYFRSTMRDLGNLYFNERQWQEALACYDEAIKAGNILLAEAYTEAGRKSEVGETSRLYAEAAYCLLQLGHLGEALVRLDRGKACLLAEVLALANADVNRLPGRYRQAMLKGRQEIRELEAEMRSTSDTSSRRSDVELRDLLCQARMELNHIVESIRAEYPDFMPVDMDMASILALIPEGGVLVAPLVTSQGSAVFIIPHGTEVVRVENVISLNGFTGDDMAALLIGDHDKPGWLQAYASFLEHRTRARLEEWQLAIEKFTGQLWQKLMGPIHEKLMDLGIRREVPVIIMPQSGLGLLPLHAAWRHVNGMKRTFLDDYAVSYAANAYALSVSRQRLHDKHRHHSKLLAVINPTSDLKYSLVEGEGVASLFAADARLTLAEDKATKHAVLQKAPGCTYLHFACHGFYDWDDAMQSGLVLAHNDNLSLSEIISNLDLSVARLVTLSACETGITDVSESPPDEYIGLPTACIQAGAVAVISSLWVVDDLSTALLMMRLYRSHVKDGLSPSSALREAQLWLRNATPEQLIEYCESSADVAPVNAQGAYHLLKQTSNKPYGNPYFWAPFTLTGV